MTAKRLLVWSLLLLLLVGVAWLAWSGVRAAGQARLALADLQQLEGLAGEPSLAALPALQADLAALETHLVGARAAARPFLWLAPAFGWLPQVGPTVRAGPPLLDMAVELAGGGRQAVDALAPMAGLLASRGQGGEDLLARAVPMLASAQPSLAQADARLAAAEAARSAIRGPLHPKLAPQLERLDRILPLARAGLQVAQVAPGLLGNDGPRSYLVLAQNNHELRATGGFISGVGFVRLERGQITDLKLGDSYAVDNFQQPHPAPPAALSEQMGAQLLVLRDSNWSPDFPTSAQVARALYQQDQGAATDGAIALDLEAVRLLVVALGPLDVPGMDGPVTADNVIEQMKQAWAAPSTTEGTVVQGGGTEWWLKRKDFMGDMVAAMMAKLQGGGDLNAVALARALLEMLDRRHLQIAVDEPTLADLLAKRGWDGGLRPPASGDFLAVVDSNVGFNKVNAAVQQQIAYRAEQAAQGLTATLVMTYSHTAQPLAGEELCDRSPRYGDSYDNLIRRCYWDYVRVYAPGGSELLESAGLDRIATERGERGTTVFAGSFLMRPGEVYTVTVHYRLPELSATPYRLMVRKQAGTLALPLHVEAAACRWDSDLAEDRIFECSLFSSPTKTESVK